MLVWGTTFVYISSILQALRLGIYTGQETVVRLREGGTFLPPAFVECFRWEGWLDGRSLVGTGDSSLTSFWSCACRVECACVFIQ